MKHSENFKIPAINNHPQTMKAKNEKQVRCPNCGIPFQSTTYATIQEHLELHKKHCQGH